MAASPLGRWGGHAAAVGGLLWIAHAVMVARMPVGCIAEECLTRPMRDTTAAAPLFIAAVLFIALGLAALVGRSRSAGRFGGLGCLALGASAAGIVGLLLALLVQTVFFRGDFPLMPNFVIPAGLALVVGFLLLGIAILRSGVLPKWTAALLVIGALAMLGANDQNTRFLLVIPFGLAWIAVGYVLWCGRDTARVQQASGCKDIRD
ncbi:MAG: hypothetical protein M3R24_24055 [Chloroflexota bacterium]|nr:hypothetical protein [Chloroflexota bacterium]